MRSSSPRRTQQGLGVVVPAVAAVELRDVLERARAGRGRRRAPGRRGGTRWWRGPRRRSGRSRRSRPRRRSASSRPATMRRNVDLPEPLWPMSATDWPGGDGQRRAAAGRRGRRRSSVRSVATRAGGWRGHFWSLFRPMGLALVPPRTPSGGGLTGLDGLGFGLLAGLGPLRRRRPADSSALARRRDSASGSCSRVPPRRGAPRAGARADLGGRHLRRRRRRSTSGCRRGTAPSRRRARPRWTSRRRRSSRRAAAEAPATPWNEARAASRGMVPRTAMAGGQRRAEHRAGAGDLRA